MDLSTDFLRTFTTLATCKSFSIASGKLHKSQSATSTQIAKLEEQAGLKLVDRSQRPLKLTEAGELFLSYAQEIITRVDELSHSLRSLSAGNLGEVRIGATRSVGTFLLPKIVQGILKQFSNLKILLITQPRALTYQLLQEGTIDFAVIMSDLSPKGFRVTPLRSEPLCLVASSKHPLAKQKIISAQQLQKSRFITGIRGNGYSEMLDQLSEQSGLPEPSATLQISTLQGRTEAAKAGLGVTVLPHFVVDSAIRIGALTKLTFKNIRLVSVQIMLVQRARTTPRANVDQVMKLIVEKLRHA
jgi:LysR family transcriptional regulator, transcriptional activator of the cysJI operon